MDTYTRSNAWNNGGTFQNSDLYWYAAGVGKMMERTLDDPASWWFFAAIHGEYANPATPWYPSPPSFPAWDCITQPPAVAAAPLPSQALQDRFWNQCQHGTWYFLPWHRGYLLALERQLRLDIVSLGGPASWALPYWDYFGGVQPAQAAMPPAFALPTCDDKPNPLYVAMRYGPDNDGTIYIPTPAWEDVHGSDPNWSRGDVVDTCMLNDVFTGTDAATPLPGFGGPDTGFSHPGTSPHGNMEHSPHDLVHVYVGGGRGQGPTYGLMADPGTAALDPIFYLHHCNIDRMWAVWNASGNANPLDPAWCDGPPQQFLMPMAGQEPWVYTPAQMSDLAALGYSYQEAAPVARPAMSRLKLRLIALGAIRASDNVLEHLPANKPLPRGELVGANAGPLQVTHGLGAHTAVVLHPDARARVLASLRHASVTAPPDQLYLKLENVRGTQDATVLRVYVDLPPQPDAAAWRAHDAGSVGLFGLRRASVVHGAHAGAGLNFILDVSLLVDQLYLQNKLAAQAIQVRVRATTPLLDATPIEVGRVSLYRQPY